MLRIISGDEKLPATSYWLQANSLFLEEGSIMYKIQGGTSGREQHVVMHVHLSNQSSAVLEQIAIIKENIRPISQ